MQTRRQNQPEKVLIQA